MFVEVGSQLVDGLGERVPLEPALRDLEFAAGLEAARRRLGPEEGPHIPEPILLGLHGAQRVAEERLGYVHGAVVVRVGDLEVDLNEFGEVAVGVGGLDGFEAQVVGEEVDAAVLAGAVPAKGVSDG